MGVPKKLGLHVPSAPSQGLLARRSGPPAFLPATSPQPHQLQVEKAKFLVITADRLGIPFLRTAHP